MNKNTIPLNLGSDKISRLLLRYAIPSIIAMISTSIYNISDSIFIGQGVGPIAISGLALTLPIMNIATAFGVLVGIGASAIISIGLGQGNYSSVEKILGNVILLNIIISLSFTIVTLSNLDTILYFFGASEATLPYARSYIEIIICGTIVTHLYYSLNEVLRATGYPKRAMVIMLTAVVCNIILNPIFIFTFNMGIQGAAIATVISQSIALLLSIIHFYNPNSFVRIKASAIRLNRGIISSILAIGLAPFLMHICSSIVIVFFNRALHGVGGDMSDLYIGANGIINRYALLFIMTIIGLNQGMQPIVGYNYGAKRYDRVVRAFSITVSCAVLVTMTGFIMTRLFPEQIAGLFIDANSGVDAELLIGAVVESMNIAFAGFAFVGFQIVVSSFFQYIGKAKKSIIMSMSRQLIFLVPLLIVLPRYWGVKGVWMAIPISDMASTLLAAVFIYFQIRKFRQDPNGERTIVVDGDLLKDNI